MTGEEGSIAAVARAVAKAVFTAAVVAIAALAAEAAAAALVATFDAEIVGVNAALASIEGVVVLASKAVAVVVEEVAFLL